MLTIHLYLLAGLGFDQRFFQNLQLNAPHIHHLHWIEPEPNEGLAHYAQRMSTQVEPSNAPIALLGHSFGGVMMQEIAKIIPVQKIILISSMKSVSEKPANFKWFNRFPITLFLNIKLTIRTFPFWAKQYGYESPEEQRLFIEMVSEHSDNYLQWAARQLAIWQGNGSLRTPIVHLHGDNDKTIPAKNFREVTIVKNGSHIMAFNQAELVSKWINEQL